MKYNPGEIWKGYGTFHYFIIKSYDCPKMIDYRDAKSAIEMVTGVDFMLIGELTHGADRYGFCFETTLDSFGLERIG